MLLFHTISGDSMKKFALVLLFLVSFVPMQEEVSLMIVAHPDDEILWGGASLSHHRYVVVCMTNGDHPIRSVEFERVMLRSGKESMMF